MAHASTLGVMETVTTVRTPFLLAALAMVYVLGYRFVSFGAGADT